MAIKKSDLYSSLWASCDELRGGMDASQYKDYVLVMLFVKYVSDKYAGVPYAPITIPEGASFADMVKLKGKDDIGDQINKKIITPIADANKLADMPDFNDSSKLGSDKEMVDRLTSLIAIFENKALDFSKNRADDDDILGDAYEFLMRHFATESGKSKGQFYTPAEVSKILAKIIGINKDNSTSDTTAYDPTCGSGSLLLKVGEEAEKSITLYGQEKDSATSGLARMNMILHNNPTAEIKQGNTLAKPLFVNEHGGLKTFDYVVANPPFSDKRWENGVDAVNDPHSRFTGFGVPPSKNGDYAYLLHIVRSLKSVGKGACILPHGVLFRGNAESEIRKNLIRKGYIKGIIGLPANLFYGTGIPACIILVDKEDAAARKGIFMVDASRGFMKDGNKNRLRNMDLHKIVDVFNKQTEIAKFSRMVSVSEIEKNEFNLNIPRYIDSQEKEDLQDIAAHLQGGVPVIDVEAMKEYWTVFKGLKKSLFKTTSRDDYYDLCVKKEDIKETIFTHDEFTSYMSRMDEVFNEFRNNTVSKLKNLESGFKPKELVHELSEDLLERYAGLNLIDKYDVYQHLMNYWEETLQDDSYIITIDGWKAETHRITETNKKGKEVDKGWTCDLIPPELIINKFFAVEKKNIEDLETTKENMISSVTELEEEHGGDEGYFGELDKVNKGTVQKRIKELKDESGVEDELKVLKEYVKFTEEEAKIAKKIKNEQAELDNLVYSKYPEISESEIKDLVINDKWMDTIESSIRTEMDRISQHLTQRIKELSERYENPLPELETNVKNMEIKVEEHLKKMGFSWN